MEECDTNTVLEVTHGGHRIVLTWGLLFEHLGEVKELAGGVSVPFRADVALLSMFPEEEEVLFPPNTAMIVMRPELATKVDDDGKRYLVVDAKPSFI